MTLPLIHALQQADKSTKKSIIRIIKSDKKDKASINKVIQFVIDYGGINYAKDHLKNYHQKALDVLNEIEGTSNKQSLIDLLDFVINRKK